MGRKEPNQTNKQNMTKMVAMPIYGKNPLKILSRTRRPMTLGLGM